MRTGMLVSGLCGFALFTVLYAAVGPSWWRVLGIIVHALLAVLGIVLPDPEVPYED